MPTGTRIRIERGRTDRPAGGPVRASPAEATAAANLVPQRPRPARATTAEHVLFLQRAVGNAQVVGLLEGDATRPAARTPRALGASPGACPPPCVQRTRVTAKETPILRATARIDAEDAGRIIFTAPVTLAEAAAYLWAPPPSDPTAIRADPAERSVRGRQTRFLVRVRDDLGLALSMQHGLAEAYLRRIRAGGRAKASSEPAVPIDQQMARFTWLPSGVRERIVALERSGGFAARSLPWSAEFPGTAPYGRIFAWVGFDDFRRRSVEFFQEYPTDEAFYRKAYRGRDYAAHLCHVASVQFNRDMRYFVIDKRVSPSEARMEIRRINAEVLVLILGAVGGFYASAGGAIGGIRRPPETVVGGLGKLGRGTRSAPGARQRLASGAKAEASAVEGATSSTLSGRSRGIKVNAGGTGESPGFVNLNPLKEHSGGQTRDIPNLVKRPLEDIGEAFPEGSVAELISNRLRYADVTSWTRAAVGAYKAMSPGGKVSMNVWASQEEAVALRLAFRAASFRDVHVRGSGVGTILEAVR